MCSHDRPETQVRPSTSLRRVCRSAIHSAQGEKRFCLPEHNEDTPNDFVRSTDQVPVRSGPARFRRSEEHTSELQSLMRISYAVFCLKQKKNTKYKVTTT